VGVFRAILCRLGWHDDRHWLVHGWDYRACRHCGRREVEPTPAPCGRVDAGWLAGYGDWPFLPPPGGGKVNDPDFIGLPPGSVTMHKPVVKELAPGKFEVTYPMTLTPPGGA
jgi:hypothetical protein